MMMGHDPLATGLELVEAYVEAKSRPVDPTLHELAHRKGKRV
jgi:hypothetical protein